MGHQLELFPISGIKEQSVSKGASRSETEQQRQFQATMEQFESSYNDDPDEEKPRKQFRTTQKSKSNHYGISKT